MRLSAKLVVVAGGGSGIGRALVRRLAREQSAGIVVADLDWDAARAVAAEIAQGSLSVTCDVTDASGVEALLAAASDEVAPVDCFFANAGVAIGTDEQTPENAWDRAFAVNVRAHVRAARLLIPRWLERAGFLLTASAAGMLTQIGVAPDVVTKHAAVGFAEW